MIFLTSAQERVRVVNEIVSISIRKFFIFNWIIKVRFRPYIHFKACHYFFLLIQFFIGVFFLLLTEKILGLCLLFEYLLFLFSSKAKNWHYLEILDKLFRITLVLYRIRHNSQINVIIYYTIGWWVDGCQRFVLRRT